MKVIYSFLISKFHIKKIAELLEFIMDTALFSLFTMLISCKVIFNKKLRISYNRPVFCHVLNVNNSCLLRIVKKD